MVSAEKQQSYEINTSYHGEYVQDGLVVVNYDIDA